MSYEPLQFGYDPAHDAGFPNHAPHTGEAIARQKEPFRSDFLKRLRQPNTGTPYLTRALEKYLPSLLLSDGVAVPDDPEEMRWRLFFAHSQDMQGFRADIFTGGPNEENNPYSLEFQGLRDRWPDGKTMLEGLAALWLNPEPQQTLKHITYPFRPAEERALGTAPALALLRGPHGNEATRVFAEAFDELKGYKIAHKTNAIVRAYCQNAAVLEPHGYCFRSYLMSVTPGFTLPIQDVTECEARWRSRIQRDFYNVGPALAPYLIADWLFWLWRNGQIEWFDSYKADSVWLKSLAQGTQSGEAVVPQEATVSPEAFVAYCRTLLLPPEWIPARLWHIAYCHLPPRLVNEILWLQEAATGEQLKAALPPPLSPIPDDQDFSKQDASEMQDSMDDDDPQYGSKGLGNLGYSSEDVAWLNRRADEEQNEAEMPVEVEETEDEDIPTYVPLLEPIITKSETEEGTTMGMNIRMLPRGDELFLMAFTSPGYGAEFLKDTTFYRLTQPLSMTRDLFLSLMQVDTRITGIVFDPGASTQHVMPRSELLETLIASEQLNAEEILSMGPLSEVVSGAMLSALAEALRTAGINHAKGVWVTLTDMRHIWMIAIPTSDARIIAQVHQLAVQALRPLTGLEMSIQDIAVCDLSQSKIAADFGCSLLGPVAIEAQKKDQLPRRLMSASGRHIYLSRLRLFSTYEGCLEGSLKTNSASIRRRLRKSVGEDLPRLEAIVILDNEEEILPDWQWVAEFGSRSAVQTRNSDYGSALGVCWFSSELPTDLPQMLELVLKHADYDANAEDVDLMP